MSKPKHFDLIVEGKNEDDPYGITPPFLHLTNLRWDGDSPPDAVRMEGGTLLIKIGRYLAPGDQYRYRVATCAQLVGGQLEAESE
jgi:hypothetical protein